MPSMLPLEVLELYPLVEENLVFGASDLTLMPYAKMVESGNHRPPSEDLFIISFWRKNAQLAAKQYECWSMLEVKDLIMRPLSQEADEAS